MDINPYMLFDVFSRRRKFNSTMYTAIIVPYIQLYYTGCNIEIKHEKVNYIAGKWKKCLFLNTYTTPIAYIYTYVIFQRSNPALKYSCILCTSDYMYNRHEYTFVSGMATHRRFIFSFWSRFQFHIFHSTLTISC